MSAAPLLFTPPSTAVTPSLTLVAYANSLHAAGRGAEAEAALHDAITIDPGNVEAHRALALLLIGAGRDIEAFSACGTMLSRAGDVDATTLRLTAEILLFLHVRHRPLIACRSEPARLDFRSIGVPDVAPLILAPEFLSRAHDLAQAAVERAPTDAGALCALAECELNAGDVGAAWMAAEQAALLDASPGPLVARALTTFADHREAEALAQLCQPQLTELAPGLGTGQQFALRVVESTPIDSDARRKAWAIPYVVHHAEVAHARSVCVRTGPSELYTIRDARVAGGLFFPIDRTDRAFVDGIVDEPDVEFAAPRCHDIPAMIAHGRNCVLWSGSDGRALLHSPAGERLRGGRAFLLASNASANYHNWIADALGRLSAMPEVLSDPDVRFVVPSPLLPFQVETLGWLGITLDRVVQVAPDEIVEFDEVHVVAHRKDGGCTDADVWRWLQAHLTIPAIAEATTANRRLFVQDGEPGQRQMCNASDVESICLAHDFESVQTASMTVAERRDLFSGAAMVASPIGAGLTDLLFAPAGARTIVFGLQSFVAPGYSALAHALGHSVRYVLGAEEPTRQVYPHWDYHIDTRSLGAALRAELA